MTKYDLIQETLRDSPRTWLITGVAGFIGSNLLEKLLLLNQKVIGIDNFVTGQKSNLLQVERLIGPRQWKNFTFISGDIRNIEDCQLSCQEVDYVLHQAALGSVPRSIDNPIATNEHNVNGFLNMLVAARDCKVESFTYAASSSTYGDDTRIPRVEANIGKPLSPYAVTKLVNELYAEVFSRCYGMDTIGLRYFNVFGRRQDPNGAYAAVIPKWTAAIINSECVYINGDGSTTRDFCYIENVVQANILAATSAKNTKNEIYNIAVGNSTTLKELYQIIRDKTVEKIPNLKLLDPINCEFRSGDVMHSLADVKKARDLLGYLPTHSLDQGLSEFLKWYFEVLGTR